MLETQGAFAEADIIYLELDKLLVAALAAKPNDGQLKNDLADAKEARASIAQKLRDFADASSLYREAEPFRRELILLFPLNPNYKYRLGNNLANQAVLEARSDLPAAKKKLDEALAISGKLAKEFPKNDIFTFQDGRWREWRKQLDAGK